MKPIKTNADVERLMTNERTRYIFRLFDEIISQRDRCKNSWWAHLPGYGKDGRKNYKPFATKAEVTVQLLKDMLADIEIVNQGGGVGMTFGEACRLLGQDQIARTAEARSRLGFLKEFFDDYRFEDINQDAFDEYVGRRELPRDARDSIGRHVKEQSSLVCEYNLLQTVYRKSRDKMLVEAQPQIPEIFKPQAGKGADDEYWTWEQMQDVLTACRTRYMRREDRRFLPQLYVLVALQIYHGARVQAAFGLTWKQIDFARGAIDYRKPGETREATKGTYLSRRQNKVAAKDVGKKTNAKAAPMYGDLEPILRLYQAKGREGRLFGEPQFKTLSNMLVKVLEEQGLREKSVGGRQGLWHMFRHSLITHLLGVCNMTPQAVATITGNSPDVIVKYYGKWIKPEHVAKVLDEKFGHTHLKLVE